jgi:mono/diheme cytochrome c family protein
MFFRSRISLLLAVLLLLLATIPAFAGGWAVITLDELPSGAAAGEPLTIGFTVRQHGRTLMVGLSPKVTAALSGETLVFPAQAEGGPGHYTATLTLPKEGDWHWGIEAFTMYQPMPVLKVAAAGTAAAQELPAVSLLSSLMMPLSLAAIVLGLFVGVVGLRRKSRTTMLLTALCLLAGFVLLAVGSGSASRVEARAQSEFSSDSSTSQVELGRQLFLAKGCITCHTNTRASRDIEYWTIGNGAPDLSKFSAAPEGLRLRLKDPTLVKPDTQMPNLQLKGPEIEALIAFINSK